MGWSRFYRRFVTTRSRRSTSQATGETDQRSASGGSPETPPETPNVPCPSCQGLNLTDARFCMNCGQELGAPQSGPVHPQLRQYMPASLISKLEGSRLPGGREGERRIVTMLFCDVQGSTAAAERLDPEDWTEIMNGAFRHLIAPVYRYEGIVARLMGDAVLAFFGAPIAHEDDPQRAVLAGLDIINGIIPYQEEIRQKWGLEIAVRVGINTGLVVVGDVGSDLFVEYTAQGDAINLAARMEQTAQAGTVQIAEDTYRLVSPLFEVEDLGGIEVKGKREPVHAYRVLASKTKPGSLRGIDGLDAPLIARDSEMTALRDGVEGLLRGNGRIISVMGEAGLGKSRLISELQRSLLADGLLPMDEPAPEGSEPTPGTLRWLEGRCVSYEMAIPYSFFIDLFQHLFGLQQLRSDQEKYARISARIEELLPGRVLEVAPLLATMMGIDLEGEALEMVRYIPGAQLRPRIFQAVEEVIEGLASQEPILLFCEDLHWADPTSLDLIQRLMVLPYRVPLMLVAAFRPSPEDPSRRFHEAAVHEYPDRYTEITLRPLDEEDSKLLMNSLLPIEGLPQRLRQLIAEKGEGNPFFVEEVLRSLIDNGVVVRENSHWQVAGEIENIDVPNTLAGVINARLDRLDEESRRVAQTASVIGREFPFDALEEIYETPATLQPSLGDLERRELVLDRSRPDTRTYLFKHALTQEGAYGSLLLRRRRELHLRVAECLEGLAPDLSGEIGRHFWSAGEESRALPYLVDAGDSAAKSHSLPEAIGYYRQILTSTAGGSNPHLARRAYEGLGAALTSSNQVEGALENYRAMLQMAEEYNDQPMKVSALNKLGFVTALIQGHFLEAEEQYLVDSEKVANGCNDLPGLAELHMIYCYLRVPFGEFEEAIEHLQESARIGQELDLEERRLFGMTHTANSLTYLTSFEEANQATQQALQVAREIGNRKWIAELLGLSSALYHLRNGDLTAAYAVAEEGAALAAQIGASEQEGYGTILLSIIDQLRGDYGLAVRHLEKALEAGRRSGIPFLEAVPLCTLGSVYLEISSENLDSANEFQSKALELMEKPLGAVMGTFVWAQVGFCALAAGNLERASEFFEKGLTVPTAMKFLTRPQLLIGSALVALGRNDLAEANRLIGEARQFVAEREMKHLYPLVHLGEAHLNVASGQVERALEEFQLCESLAHEMGMRPLMLQARTGAAGVLSETGRVDEAEALQRSARTVVEEIASSLDDPELRDLFCQSVESKLG